MSEEKKYSDFNLTDIEKYHRNELSPKERHAIEKAALDDPFLADALEGYSRSGVNVSGDITELENRLSERIKAAKVIVMTETRRTWFTGWKVAAMIILIAGAGLLVYQFAYNNRTETIAQQKPEETKQLASKDSGQTVLPAMPDTVERSLAMQSEKDKKISGKEEVSKNIITKKIVGSGMSKTQTDTYSLAMNNNKPPVTLSFIQHDKKPKQIIIEKNGNSVAKNIMELKTSEEQSKLDEIATMKKSANKEENIPVEKPYANNNSAFFKAKGNDFSNRLSGNVSHYNIFKGRVTDMNNNPLPFANIMNTADSIGTYADANGYFNLTSPDSVINVRIQSLGFINSVSQLKKHIKVNNVALREDMNMNAVILSEKKPNAAHYNASNLKIEEPEPADGWDNYDVYIANNLKVPEYISMKDTRGNVEISFDVDKKGEPVNIKIEKSLCEKCDKEAIRLIRQGPKWKSKAQNIRTNVIVSF